MNFNSLERFSCRLLLDWGKYIIFSLLLGRFFKSIVVKGHRTVLCLGLSECALEGCGPFFRVQLTGSLVYGFCYLLYPRLLFTTLSLITHQNIDLFRDHKGLCTWTKKKKDDAVSGIMPMNAAACTCRYLCEAFRGIRNAAKLCLERSA